MHTFTNILRIYHDTAGHANGIVEEAIPCMSLTLFIYIIATLFSFFLAGALVGALFSEVVRKKLVEVFHVERLRRLLLNKSLHNPILRPGTNPWTAEAVLNPGAAVLGGRTHLIYRAIGIDGVSRLGYASSADGVVIDDHPPYPAYVAREHHHRKLPGYAKRYSPVMYPSGGSWGGCEDPRMVCIDGRVYVTFNMFENWALRVGVISLSVEEFLEKKFTKWDGPYILSHSSRDKNWVLFPEKIGGQFAVLHSIIGDTDDRVRIEYTNDLTTFSERTFESPDPQKVSDHGIAWHVHVRSAGPPPVRTSRGWLVLYHANDAAEPHKYKLGAMLLDLDDPTKILCRASSPILVPDETYENHGKPGIVYACGAVVRDGIMYVYYGGADKVVCVASTPLEEFIHALTAGDQPQIQTVLPAQTL